MMIAAIYQKFDADMNLTDAKTAERVGRHIEDFLRFAQAAD